MTETVETRLQALEHRVGELEGINAIRRLHWAYGYYIDFNRAEDVVQLFAEDGAVVFLSGEYRGHEGVRRLYDTGWSKTIAHLQPSSAPYPENPLGPDVPMHFAHPKFGAMLAV